MLSSDENIETIGQLLRVAQHYFGLQSEYIRLDVIHKVVKVITLSAMVLMVAGLLVLALIYFSFAAAFALSTVTGLAGAFSIVGGVYILLLVIVVLNRHRWIERPLVKFLAGMFFEK